MEEKSWPDILAEEMQRRADWSDEKILEELKLLPVLPDEYIWFGKKGVVHPAWDDPKVMQQLDTYLVLAEIVAIRKLRAGVLLLLERASYGDMGETMRGLRHSLEAAFNPDWEALNDVCMQAAQYPQGGARLWAVDELGTLRDKRSLQVLFKALRDPLKLVRYEAVRGLEPLYDTFPELKDEILREFQHVLQEMHETQVYIQGAIENIG